MFCGRLWNDAATWRTRAIPWVECTGARTEGVEGEDSCGRLGEYEEEKRSDKLVVGVTCSSGKSGNPRFYEIMHDMKADFQRLFLTNGAQPELLTLYVY